MLCIVIEILVAALALLVAVRFLIADCDLTLQYFERFGLPLQVLRGKVVWITGASSGIGKALAYDLAKVGCRLILSARRSEELEKVKQKCLELGVIQDEDVLVLPLDIKDYSSHSRCVDIVLKKYGTIDVLVNNAGRSQRAEWDKVDLSVDKELFEVNVFGLISLTRAVLPHMLEKNCGQLVVTSSVAGKLGAPNSGVYSGTKFALHGYFEALRVEKLLSTDISITMVCPGPVVSDVRRNAVTETLDKSYGLEMSGNEPFIMSAERCSHLMAVAMANKLSEVWISRHPALLFVYAIQYAPTLVRYVAKLLGAKVLKNIRDGTVDQHLKSKQK